jgi:hypothetical protein
MCKFLQAHAFHFIFIFFVLQQQQLFTVLKADTVGGYRLSAILYRASAILPSALCKLLAWSFLCSLSS